MLLRALHSLQRGAAAPGGSPLMTTATAATTTPAILRRWMSSAPANDGTANPPSTPPPAQHAAADDPMAAQLEAMLDVMLKDDCARDMLLSRLPERMRRPEVVRAMLQNPEVRARLGQLARSIGLGGGGGGGAGDDPNPFAAAPDAAALERGLAAARAAGIDPAKVAARLASSPALRSAAGNPRVFSALLDICQHGPEAARKYEGDQEVLRAYFEAGEALQEVQAEARSGGGGGREVGPEAGAAAGVSDAEAAALRALVADPALAAKLSSPRVRTALEEIAKSPLKAVKYVFDSEVREALAAARRLVKESGAKQA
jgi:hypothetical protein